MSKCIQEAYEILSEVFVDYGIASNKFAKLEYLFLIADNATREVEILRQSIVAIKSAIIAMTEGFVDGYPTNELNYLQRIKELVQVERRQQNDR